MERRSREQRLKIHQRQGCRSHVHGHGRLLRPRSHRGPDHPDYPLSLHHQRPTRGQLYPLRQHHRQPGKGLRQQVARIHERVEGVGPVSHRQKDPSPAASLVPPMDQMPNAADRDRQQAQAVDGRPQGHGAEKHAADPWAGPPQGEKEQPAAQEQRRQKQGQEGTQILPAAQEQRRDQETGDPPRQAQQPRPPSQGGEVPQRPQEGRESHPARTRRRSAQGPRQLQQQTVHGEIVQQKPFQGDPHATSTTMTVMSSRCPLSLAAAISSSAMRSKGADEPR